MVGTMNVLSLFGSGAVAGLALALPLGGIGVLLLREGSLHGTRKALPAAAAVATVDTLYCILAVAAGGAAAGVLSRLAPWPSLIGGSLLIALAVHGVITTLCTPEPTTAGTPAGTGRRWFTFFVLTLVNPATLVYFAAVTAGLGDVAASGLSAAVFVVGVGIASWSWQSLLVALGGLLGRFSTPRLRLVTGVVGSLLLGTFGVVILVDALT